MTTMMMQCTPPATPPTGSLEKRPATGRFISAAMLRARMMDRDSGFERLGRRSAVELLAESKHRYIRDSSSPPGGSTVHTSGYNIGPLVRDDRSCASNSFDAFTCRITSQADDAVRLSPCKPTVDDPPMLADDSDPLGSDIELCCGSNQPRRTGAECTDVVTSPLDSCAASSSPRDVSRNGSRADDSWRADSRCERISVVERNARVIKWLCDMRKVIPFDPCDPSHHVDLAEPCEIT